MGLTLWISVKMALVIGTNCGFVTTSPTADPTEGNLSVDESAANVKDTSPSGDNIVTEMGWWCDKATQEADFELGVYDHNSGDDEAEALIGKSSPTAKGTDAGWKVVTGLNISISASTIYWLAIQLDDTATSSTINVGGSGRRSFKINQTTLEDPWGTSFNFQPSLLAVYALVETTAAAAGNSQMMAANF